MIFAQGEHRNKSICADGTWQTIEQLRLREGDLADSQVESQRGVPHLAYIQLSFHLWHGESLYKHVLCMLC